MVRRAFGLGGAVPYCGVYTTACGVSTPRIGEGLEGGIHWLTANWSGVMVMIPFEPEGGVGVMICVAGGTNWICWM